MENVRIPLLFDTMRYDPRILFILEATSKTLQQKLQKAVDYLQTMIEELHLK